VLFQTLRFIVVSHWLSMCWFILANTLMRSCQSRRMSVILQKIPNIFIVRVCILCIVEQRRKSWSIHIFNNILLAYYSVLFLAGWLLYMYTYKNSCRILCISYVHFICNHCLHSGRRRYLYCYLLLPVRTYTDTYILI